MTTKNSTFSNAKWASIGTIVQVTVQLTTLIILARLIAPSEFGIAATATLVIQFLYIFSEFGIGTLLIQRWSVDAAFIQAAYFFSCLTALFVAGCVFLTSPMLANWFDTHELSSVLRVYSIYLIINGVTAIHTAVAQRELKYRHLAQVDILSYAIGYGAISILLAFFGWSYWSVVAGYIAQILFKLILLEKSFRPAGLSRSFIPHIIELLKFGIGQSLSRTGSYVAGQVDSFVVATKMGMAPIGIYSRAHQLATMPANQLGSIFDKLLFPLLARRQDNAEFSQSIYCANLLSVTIIGVAASILIWVSADLIVALILGQDWIEVSEPLKILALAIPARLVQHISDPTARAFGSTYRRAWRQWIYALLTALLALSLSSYGLSVVAAGIFLASTINAALMISLCGQILRCSPRRLLSCLTPAIIFSSLSAILISALPKMVPGTFSEIGVGILCCSLSAIAFWYLLVQKKFREALYSA